MDKLVDDLRQDARLILEHVANGDASARVLAGSEHAEKLDKAADEITRLKGEVEVKTKLAADIAAVSEEALTKLAAKQALIDELVEGLKPFAKFIEQYDRRPLQWPDEFYAIHMGTEFEASLHLSDCRSAQALISKARSSGKAGSDA